MQKLHLLLKSAVCCLSLLTVTTISANDIHVDTHGSDDNTGSETAPLLTIHKAMEIVQPGDRILIHEGTYIISERIKIPALNTNPDLRLVAASRHLLLLRRRLPFARRRLNIKPLMSQSQSHTQESRSVPPTSFPLPFLIKRFRV